MMITDVTCGKVTLYVLGMYGGWNDLGEFMRELGGVLTASGGEAGIRTQGTRRHTRFRGALHHPDSDTSPVLCANFLFYFFDLAI